MNKNKNNHKQKELEITKPIYSAVKPISVNIVTKEKQVSADKRYEVECKTAGSRPEAYVTWWKNNRQLKRMAKNVSTLYVERLWFLVMSGSDFLITLFNI